MAYTWTGIRDSPTVKADDIMEGISQAEELLNQGIGKNTFRDPNVVSDPYARPGHTAEGYIEKRHIYKPDFYGAPAPRIEAVSSQVHWRTTGHNEMDGVIFTPSNSGGGWDIIPGSATRLKLRDHARVFFTSTFYCYELGGLQHVKGKGSVTTNPFYKDHDKLGGETRVAGTVAVAIHGKDTRKSEYIGSTRRYIYTSTLRPDSASFDGTTHPQAKGFCLLTMLGRHQHSIVTTISLSPGVYDIGLVFNCREILGTEKNAKSTVASPTRSVKDGEILGGRIPMNKTVFFMARNMVCDAVYRKRAAAEEELESWRTINDKDPQAI